MKRVIFFLLVINSVFSLFADGRQERYKQPYDQIQLKIVNLTDNTINFYFNKLYGTWGIDRWQIRRNEEFITMNVPINNDNPGFIGIDYDSSPGAFDINDRNILIYRIGFLGTMRIRENWQFIIVIMESNIHFIEGNIDEVYNYYDESLYHVSFSESTNYQSYNSNWYWTRIRYGNNNISIVIENNTENSKIIRISTILENQKEIRIRNGVIEEYKIDQRLYELGGINIQVSDGGGTVNIINFRITRIYRPESNSYEVLNTIYLKINNNGHEIKYN